MLKHRIITALVLAPLIIWSVLAFSHRALAIEFALILMLAAWEWARISGLVNQLARIAYSIFIALVIAVTAYLIHRNAELSTWILYGASAWWLFSLIWLYMIERSGLTIPDHFSFMATATNLLIGIFILLGAFVALTGIHQSPDYGAKYIFILLIFIWLADTAAYFTGRAVGKHKLAPTISPGKTWEGVVGALIATVITAFGIAIYLELTLTGRLVFVLIALITVIFSIVGDLFESLFKRRAKVKDSSQILPGHGGILDRIDSLVAAAPVFLLGLLKAGMP